MIDTAGTLCANVKELKAMGAGDIYVCATHGIFSGPAIERLNDAPIVECVVTDASPSRSAARSRPSRSPRSSLRPSPPFTTRSPSPRSSAATSRCSRIVLATRRIAAGTEETPALPLASQRSRGVSSVPAARSAAAVLLSGGISLKQSLAFGGRGSLCR